MKEIKFEILFFGGILISVGYLFFYLSNDDLKVVIKWLNFNVIVIYLRKLFIKYLFVVKWVSCLKIVVECDKRLYLLIYRL